jgi:hypothetical protein
MANLFYAKQNWSLSKASLFSDSSYDIIWIQDNLTVFQCNFCYYDTDEYNEDE